jgi:hypothetical protein
MDDLTHLFGKIDDNRAVIGKSSKPVSDLTNCGPVLW